LPKQQLKVTWATLAAHVDLRLLLAAAILGTLVMLHRLLLPLLLVATSVTLGAQVKLRLWPLVAILVASVVVH
jgi:hypothetical protein